MALALWRRLRRAARADAGFTLVEVVVACLVLMILAGAIFSVLATTLQTTREDKNRVAASQLAARELEILRQQFYTQASDGSYPNVATIVSETKVTNPDPLPNGVVGAPSVVGNTPYGVTVQVEPQIAGPGASACEGGFAAKHPAYQATATVTWNRNGVTQSVTNTTLLTPPKGVVNDTGHGFYAVKVLNAAGSGNVNRTVTVTGPAVQGSPVFSDASGCAIGTVSASGTYAATLGESGYVDFYGNSTPSVRDAVTVGQLKVHAAPIYYDRAAALSVTFSTQNGYNLPQQLPYLSLGNGEITPQNVGIARSGVINAAPTGATTTVGSLWPFTDGYSVWAGSCSDANPAVPPTNGSTPAAIIVAPGQTGTAQAQLTPVAVSVIDGDGNPVAGVTVWAMKPSGTTSGCESDASLQLGTSDADGNLDTSLPDGNWYVSDGGTNSGAPFTVTGTATTTQLSMP